MFSERDYNRRPTNDFQSYWNGHTIVFHLVVINAVVFLLDMLFGQRLTGHFALYSGLGGSIFSEPWRYVTYQFLHADFFHILFNCWAIRVFGQMVEERLGRSRFLIMYLFSGVIGGFLWKGFNANNLSVLVGASGAVFGIMVAAAMAFPNARMALLFPPISMRLWTLTVGYCIIEVFCALSASRGNIAHLAHLGGALGGFIFMRRLGFHLPSSDENGYYRPRRESTPPPRDDSSRQRPFSFGGEKPFVFSSAELDRILDKMARQGEAHLTPEEREYLHRASEELKKRQ